MPNHVLAFLVAMVVAVAVTPAVIFFAEKTGALDAPDARKVHKKPVPRIGGVGIYIAFMVAMLSFMTYGELSDEVLTEMAGLMTGGSLIVLLGLIDDYKNLPAKVKLLGQIVCACVLVAFDVRIDFITDPFGDYLYLEYLAIPATIFWIVGLTNTVNLIDGLDGLAAGVATIASVTICLVALQQGYALVAVLTAALAGAAIGFLFYNFNPAKIFMGDTGALALGGAVAGLSILTQTQLLAIVVGGLFVAVVLSDVIQIGVFKATGKRVFRMAPLHHHFELLGWKEVTIVIRFWLIAAIIAVAGAGLFYAEWVSAR